MLKRTCLLCYGKKNQRLEAMGQMLLKQGKSEQAKPFFDRSAKLLKAKRKNAGL
jgi:hypothetical protein